MPSSREIGHQRARPGEGEFAVELQAVGGARDDRPCGSRHRFVHCGSDGAAAFAAQRFEDRRETLVVGPAPRGSAAGVRRQFGCWSSPLPGRLACSSDAEHVFRLHQQHLRRRAREDRRGSRASAPASSRAARPGARLTPSGSRRSRSSAISRRARSWARSRSAGVAPRSSGIEVRARAAGRGRAPARSRSASAGRAC